MKPEKAEKMEKRSERNKRFEETNQTIKRCGDGRKGTGEEGQVTE
jgi:hypothetical protein